MTRVYREDKRFFCWEIGRFQIVRFPRSFLRFAMKRWPKGEYEFIGIGWGHRYFGLFTAGVRRPKK